MMMKYENSKNIKASPFKYSRFQIISSQTSVFFHGTPGMLDRAESNIRFVVQTEADV